MTIELAIISQVCQRETKFSTKCVSGYGLGYGGYYGGYGLGYGGYGYHKREAEAEPSIGYGLGLGKHM